MPRAGGRRVSAKKEDLATALQNSFPCGNLKVSKSSEADFLFLGADERANPASSSSINFLLLKSGKAGNGKETFP